MGEIIMGQDAANIIFEYICCDCGNNFKTKTYPRTIIGSPLCDKCSKEFDGTLKKLKNKGVEIDISKPE